MENNNTWKIDINAKNVESSGDIIDLIADAIGIKWHEIWYLKRENIYAKSFNSFIDNMRDIKIDSNIENVIINIKEPKNHKNNKKNKLEKISKNDLIGLKEQLNDEFIPEFISHHKKNLTINWIK